MSLATLATFVSSLVRPRGAKTGGSRELPIGSQLCSPGAIRSERQVMLSLGYSTCSLQPEGLHQISEAC